MNAFSSLRNWAKKSRFFRYGLPFIVFVVGGSFALQQFATVRYDVSSHYKHLGMTKEQMRMIGYDPSKNQTLEEAFEEMTKKVDINNWKNIRGPRPWETDSKEYKELIEERIAEREKRRKPAV